MFSAKRKAFTLIEMLIVIVIIGILAAALVPRMMSARDKAADVAVKADLQQIAGAISSYWMDDGGSYVDFTNGAAANMSGLLVPGYLSSMPKNSTKYTFTKINKGSTPNGAFILSGGVTSMPAANRAASFGMPTDSTTFVPCAGISSGATSATTCKAPITDTLRYLIVN